MKHYIHAMAICSIVLLECIALAKGIDSVVLTASIAGISAIAGHKLGKDSKE